jgi:multiple sugar transport system ATP-binding protein
VTVGLRPEALQLSPGGQLPAVVEMLEYLGSEVLLHTRCGPAALVARLPVVATAGLRAGDTVRFATHWGAALLFDADGAAMPRAGAAVAPSAAAVAHV